MKMALSKLKSLIESAALNGFVPFAFADLIISNTPLRRL